MQANGDLKPSDQPKLYAQCYEFSPPRPGFSLGLKSCPNSAGTLSGYIKYDLGNGEEIFGLTCDHVLNPNNLLGAQRYKYLNGQTQHLITSPATFDHKAAMQTILEIIKSLKSS